ncbi:PREDICTED: protein KBP homolog [Dinoponera quadriceps]|uniref:KIF-binding protein n=1 Tax=Dinoponera quadriceps TaxID=609295 RepID=A0A6P3XAF0_DINQU|nr:PREDICTED: protein KBP homolog [Dinoponera quadriceps]
MPITRRKFWQYLQIVCSLENQQQVETVENPENTMTVSKKFIKVLKSSFRVTNVDYENQTTKTQKKMIDDVEAKMDRLFRDVIDSEDTKFDDRVTLALSYLYMAYIYIDDKDAIQTSKSYLTKCLELLKENELDCKAILIVLRALNELSYIELVTGNIIENVSHLNKALELYLMYTKGNDDYPVPIDVASVLSIEDKISCKRLLQHIYETTLTALLDVDDNNYLPLCSEKTDIIKKALICMHKRLDDQLTTKIYNYPEWIINSVILSNYLVRYGRFTEARNHLAAANFVLQKYFADICQQVENENYTKCKAQDRYRHATAMTTLYWAKYGLALLNLSRKRAIIRREDNEANNSLSSKSECPRCTKFEMQPKGLLIFSDIEKDLEEFAVQITDKCPLDYKEAKKVFVDILKWFNDVKTYVINSNIITDSKILNEFEIGLGVSTAYRYLASFEQDKSKKIKLYKRQADSLEKMIQMFQSSTSIQTENIERFSTELIFSYSTVVDIMTDHLRADKDDLTEKESLEVKLFSQYTLNALKLYLKLSMINDPTITLNKQINDS